jgi:hypothetical protein
MTENFYTTIDGLKVPCSTISITALFQSWRGLEKEARERKEPIDTPTYKIITAGGGEEIEKHNSTTEKTPEEQAEWDAHVAAVQRLTNAKNEILAQYVFEDGLALVQLPQDTAWQEKYKRRHVEIPTDQSELHDFYISGELLKSPADIAGCFVTILMLSQAGEVKEDDLQVALESFRDYIRRPRRPAAANTAAGTGTGQESVEA